MPDRYSELSNAERPPDAAEVEAELRRVIDSRCFEQAGRAKEFLRFVVGETLAGRGDRLKGYTIGVGVFGRPPDFDAQTDPLVRVEARRLRSRLLEYYSTEGAQDPVRIELPRGGYAPRFAYADAGRGARMPLPPESQPVSRPRAPRRLFVALAVTAAAGLALWLSLRSHDAPAYRSLIGQAAEQSAGPVARRRPTVLVPTFLNLSGDVDFEYFSYGITEDVATQLGALGVAVVRGAALRDAQPHGSDPPTSGVDAEYVLTGSVQPAPDRIRVAARVILASNSTQLWAERFDEPADIKALLSIQERIAERVSSTIAAPFGPIFQNEALVAAQKPAERWDTYDCVLKYRYYRRNIDARGHRQSLDCFRLAVVREPSYADAWAGLALVYLDEHLYGYDVQPDAEDAVSRALEAARKACDIDGGNALGNVAMARVRFARGDMAEFEHAAERVAALSSSTPDDLMVIGVLLGVAGDWDKGLPLIDKAYALSGSEKAGMISAGYAIHDLQVGNYDEALQYALRYDMPDWYVATAIVVVAASLDERLDIAQRAAERLLRQQPDFSRTARAQIAKWHMNDDLLAKFVRGFNQAGIATP
jgi:adenylate cyclase